MPVVDCGRSLGSDVDNTGEGIKRVGGRTDRSVITHIFPPFLVSFRTVRTGFFYRTSYGSLYHQHEAPRPTPWVYDLHSCTALRGTPCLVKCCTVTILKFLRIVKQGVPPFHFAPQIVYLVLSSTKAVFDMCLVNEGMMPGIH